MSDAYVLWWKCPSCAGLNPPVTEKCYGCNHQKASREVAGKNYSPVDEEGKLHEEIEEFLGARRWPYIHSRMDRKTTQKCGVADFVILAPDGKTVVIEAKAKNRKQEPEQIAFMINCERVGHKYHIIRSFEQFKDVLEGELLI